MWVDELEGGVVSAGGVGGVGWRIGREEQNVLKAFVVS